MKDNALIELSHLDTMLAQATRIDEITGVRAKIEALRVYAVNIGKSHDQCQELAIVRIRAERKAGQVMLLIPKQNGARQPDAGFIDAIPHDIDGIKKSQVNSWQTIAKLPDDLFERLMKERYDSGDDITTSFFYKAAKIHLMRMRGISTDRPAPEPVEVDMELARFMFELGAGWMSIVNHDYRPIDKAFNDAIAAYKAHKAQEGTTK